MIRECEPNDINKILDCVNLAQSVADVPQMNEVNTLIPTYDFPSSPILWLGFLGIIVALAVLFVANTDYFNSPLNQDKK